MGKKMKGESPNEVWIFPNHNTNNNNTHTTPPLAIEPYFKAGKRVLTTKLLVLLHTRHQTQDDP